MCQNAQYLSREETCQLQPRAQISFEQGKIQVRIPEAHARPARVHVLRNAENQAQTQAAAGCRGGAAGRRGSCCGQRRKKGRIVLLWPREPSEGGHLCPLPPAPRGRADGPDHGLELAEGRRVNVCKDSKYASGVVRAYRATRKGRGLSPSSGTRSFTIIGGRREAEGGGGGSLQGPSGRLW